MLLLLLSCITAPPPAQATTSPLGERLGQLYNDAGRSEVGYQRLRELCDGTGARISGSPALEQGLDWAHAELLADGFQVWEQPVTVPHWVRGQESATLLSPQERPLAMLGLGMSVGGDVTAPVVVVSSREELQGMDLTGRIVLIDEPFHGYGDTVGVRVRGASEAAARGAVGLLIRSITPRSLNTPHTGTLVYSAEHPRIPAAALSIEDAALLHRLYDAGHELVVRLQMEAHREPDQPSRNLVAELPGRSHPDELVVLSCHFDSWDVGQGAQDDGAGCLIAWEALRLIKARGEQPSRTIRLILYTNEENGGAGGRAYAREHQEHRALIESDNGNGRADGFRYQLKHPEEPLREQHKARFLALSELLAPLGGGVMEPGYSGTDILPVVNEGAPGLGMKHDTTEYWPIHHSHADTFDKIVLEDLQHNAGLMAAAAWGLSELD